VAGRQQLRDEAPADIAGRAEDENLEIAHELGLPGPARPKRVAALETG